MKKMNALTLGLGLWIGAGGPAHAEQPEMERIELTAHVTTEPFPHGPLIAIVTDQSRNLVNKAPEDGRPMELASAPLVVDLGAAEATKTASFRVPAGRYQVMAFVRLSTKACQSVKSDPTPDPSCFPSAGDALCSSAVLDTTKTKKIEVFCGTAVKK